MYNVYILQSQLDQSYYIGYTSNIEQRVAYHNAGRGRYTPKKVPWELVYKEQFETKSEAIKRENLLKRMKSRAFLERLIAENG